MGRPREAVAPRFWARVEQGSPDACWLWQGAKDHDGYGLVAVGPHRHRAHRVAWALTNGPIPAGLLVCHTCDVPSCVNPAHLWLGTAQENLADMGRKGRAPAQVARARRLAALEASA